MPGDGKGLDPDYQRGRHELSYGCTDDLALPVKQECSLAPMLAGASARLTCPTCGITQEAEMPTGSCQFFYECSDCRTVMRPWQGDCCVFCSYADRLCPSKQAEQP